ncbi:uncharacterized protein LOC103518418 [Diaphorina citri]|uniref:Uncharacterized protein LOC103518418 n=1 Tax=Diaphorina citri TaxID=121845 RepID=A0A3Q0JBX7_DIACI|nr:uncharacterized protein LOC103518418 [Diaphorina citri]
MAHANNDNYPEAVQNFQRSKNTLLERVQNLKTTQLPDADISKEPFYKKENEIKELEALLPEINARIEECASDNKEIQKVISNFISGKRPAVSSDGASTSSAGEGSSSGRGGTSSKPASDILSSVGRRRGSLRMKWRKQR